MDDAQALASLLRRCQAGDAAAWEEIVRTFNRRIYNLCYRFTNSSHDAEDLTQEVFIRMYRTLHTYETARGSFVTWVTTMTRNLLVDHFRKGKLERASDSLESSPGGEDTPTLGEQLADQAAGPEDHLRSGETQAAVQRALQKLSPELREAVILRDLQEMEYKDIAKVLRVPEGTVKSRINRGRTELGRLLSRTYRRVN